ncbi:uncharacterized protein HD556DRAFT_116240 [Suillus plorans]|uniref:Uncharacterized protein n=1 Tax=Suillus plorans TaxID=116603 RepID=A0A9P7J1V9_9AGAM|nr:uncharacterized protein HD556DRAFT_116240 [Suillus plorans]KAG1799215.1 hypothetical protein HD556DRAFT_116240 [Suillus plorans]
MALSVETYVIPVGFLSDATLRMKGKMTKSCIKPIYSLITTKVLPCRLWSFDNTLKYFVGNNLTSRWRMPFAWWRQCWVTESQPFRQLTSVDDGRLKQYWLKCLSTNFNARPQVQETVAFIKVEPQKLRLQVILINGLPYSLCLCRFTTSHTPSVTFVIVTRSSCSYR